MVRRSPLALRKGIRAERSGGSVLVPLVPPGEVGARTGCSGQARMTIHLVAAFPGGSALPEVSKYCFIQANAICLRWWVALEQLSDDVAINGLLRQLFLAETSGRPAARFRRSNALSRPLFRVS